MTTKRTVTWAGDVETCDVCNIKITEKFVDGKTQMGPWALMCPKCFRAHGRGLGLGLGQQYTRRDDGKYVKTAG